MMRNSTRRRVARLASACLVLFNIGCYASIPVSSDSPRTGMRISVELTDTGTVDMASQVGPRIRSLMGDVAATNDRALVLALRSSTNNRGIEAPWSSEQVTVPRTDIASVYQRRLSRSRTTIFSIALVAGMYLAGRGISSIAGGGGHSGDLPVTQ